MSEKIVQLNEDVIKGQLKELVRGNILYTGKERGLDSLSINHYKILQMEMINPNLPLNLEDSIRVIMR